MFKNLCLVMALMGMFIITACSGCSTTGGQPLSQKQYIAMSCVGIGATLEVIAAGVKAGKINDDLAAKALAAGERVEPVCYAEEPPTLDDLALLDFRRDIGVLSEAKATADRSP